MFELTYTSPVTQNPETLTNVFIKEFFPNPEVNNLSIRTKIRLGATNSLQERISTGIILFANWIWELETANPDFQNNMSTEEPTDQQLFFRSLVSKVQLLLNNNNDYLNKLSKLLSNIAVSKISSVSGNYIINSADPSDNEIAQLIQEVLLNQLPIIINFPL